MLVQVGEESRRDHGAVARRAHALGQVRVVDGRAGDEAPVMPLAAHLLRELDRGLRRRADADEVGRIALQLRHLCREIESAELEVDRALELHAVLLHQRRQHLLTHDARDGVVVRVGDGARRHRVALALQRAHHVVEHVALVRRVAEGVLEVGHQLRRRRGHRHDDYAGAVGRRRGDLDLSGTERADDGEHLVVLRELAQPDHRLPGIARRVERDVAQLLAVHPARGVDLVDGDARRDFVGARKAHERAGLRGEIAEHELALCQSRRRGERQYTEDQLAFHRFPPR